VSTRGIAIFGYYRSAVEVAAYLRAREHRIVIIDDNQDNLDKARRAGFETEAFDYRDDMELQKLGLGSRIDTIFCLFPDDAENVFLTISARALAPSLHIFAVAHDSRSAPNLRAAGADKVIETEAITGHRIWDIMQRPLVTAILDRTLFGQADLNIAEIPVPEGSFLDGVDVGAADLESRYDLILTGIADHDYKEHFIYDRQVPETPLQPGNILLVIGPTEAIEKLKSDLSRSPADGGSERTAPSCPA
jgi:voltage-gated potassium channel